MSLTLEQVHANNLVAKEWMRILVAEIKVLRKAKAEHQALPLRKRLGMSPDSLEMRMVEDGILSTLEDMQFNLKMYFWGHYETAGFLSKYKSPGILFSTSQDKIFHTMKRTYCVADTPHPIDL